LNGADADALVALLGKQSITLTNYYVAGGGDPAVTAAAANMMAAALAKRLRALNDSRVVEARATVVPRSPPSIPDVQLCAGSSPKPEFPTAFASQAYLARGAVPVEDAPEAEVGKVREYLKNAGGIVIAYRKIDATMGAPVGNFTLLEAPPANTGPRSVEGEKVVNGTFVKEGAMPWAAAFMRVADDGRLEAFCGGTLISSNWVLTAAHCEIEDNSEVIIGRTNLAATNGQVRKVKRSWRHVAFRRAARFDSDIALVQLSSAVGLQAAKLADGAPAQNAVVIVAGWGVTEEGGRTTQLLGSVDLNVEPQDTCEFQYANTIATVTDNMFCASKFLPAPKDACQGDSGGGAFIAPGTRPFAQVGIVSYGKGCATPGFPGVYTKLAPFRQWMDEVRQATGVQ
jgi:hypothetical protein